jgi:hypothetical protein
MLGKGVLVGFTLSLMVALPMSSQAATTSYFDGYTLPNVTKSSVAAGVKGGTVAGEIGGRASAVIQTRNVFGVVTNSTTAPKGVSTSMTHSIRYDARSECYWYNWDATTPARSNSLHCRVMT